jgi:hypothetical protein
MAVKDRIQLDSGVGGQLMASAPIVEEERSNRDLIYAAIVIVAGVLATTLGQAQLLGRIPIQNLLKNELHVDRTANAAFFFWIGLAWYFKPIAGIITDAFPLFGTRRKSYMIVSTAMAVLSWVGLYFTPHQYNKLLYVCIVINFFMVIASTVVGAYMVVLLYHSRPDGRVLGKHCVRLDLRGLWRRHVSPAAGRGFFPSRAAQTDRFPGVAGERRQANGQDRSGENYVGGVRVDGAILHRTGFQHGHILQAAE